MQAVRCAMPFDGLSSFIDNRLYAGTLSKDSSVNRDGMATTRFTAVRPRSRRWLQPDPLQVFVRKLNSARGVDESIGGVFGKDQQVERRGAIDAD